ncbi:hypothetical protein FOL47_001508, partial [Perkinsus chesapeaki]
TGTVCLDRSVTFTFKWLDGEFTHKFLVVPYDYLYCPILGTDFLIPNKIILDYSVSPPRYVRKVESGVSYATQASSLNDVLVQAQKMSTRDFAALCSKSYVDDGWICYPDQWSHYEYVYKNEYFAVSIAINDISGKKRVFTGINPGAIVKPSASAVKSQLKPHRKLHDDLLPAEVIPYLERWITTGKLVWLSEFNDDNIEDVAMYHPIVTQWYLVKGSKKCRPVFTYTLLNNSIKKSKILIQFEQRKLHDIIVRTRVYNRVLFTDLHDAYLSLRLYTSNYPLNVVRFGSELFYFAAVSFGTSPAPQSLECTMGRKLMKELSEKMKEQDDAESKECSSESFMDDVAHLDDKLNLDDEFVAEPILESIAEEYDIHFNNAKRQYINALPGDVSALGVVYTDYGRFIKFSDVQWVKFRDALTARTQISYTGALSLLGKLPDLVVTGAWNSLFKHMLQGMVFREVHLLQVPWSASVSDELRQLLYEWHALVLEAGTLYLPRCYDMKDEITVVADASKWVAGYELRQNNTLYDEGSMVFPRSKADIAISVKELQAVYMGLAAVNELEMASPKKFKAIKVVTDNTTVATILRTRRVTGSAKREFCPILQKYLALIQELYSPNEWVRLHFEVVSTEENSADKLTRHPYLTKLLNYRDKLQRVGDQNEVLDDYDEKTGTVTMVKLVFYVPFIWRVAHDVVEECERCVMNKRPAGVMPMRTTIRSTYPWQILHMDIVSYENMHLLTVIDQFSKYLCWEILATMSTSNIVIAMERIFSKLGPPKIVVCDNAKNLNATVMVKFLEAYGTKLENSTSYHPQGNSVVERVHRTLHRLARLHQLHSPQDLKRSLSKLVYVYNCRPHKALGYRSPYYVLFGRNPLVVTDIAKQSQHDMSKLYDTWDEVGGIQGQQFRSNKVAYDKRHRIQRPVDYYEGQEVLYYRRRRYPIGVNAKLQDPWEDGWKVLKAPTVKYPTTVVIGRGSQRMVTNVAYITRDTRQLPRESVDKPTMLRTSPVPKPNITALCEMVSEPDDDLDYKFYLDDDEDNDKNITLRRSKRVKKPVRRLTFGLGNSKSYD